MRTEYLNEIALAEKIAIPKPGDCPYALFLGAGASVSSGIPSANAMVYNWQKLLYKSIKQIRNIDDEFAFNEWIQKVYPMWKKQHQSETIESDYSLLFNYFYQQPKERQLFIEQIIESKKPSFGYLYLAGLISDRRFNRILTTNFDDLLNDTLVKYYDTKPIVCAFDSAVAGIRIASQRPKIIKLHGDYLYDNIRNMKHELKSLDSNMEEKMYEMCKDSGLIVVGYSGDDESIMAPLRDMIRKTEYLNMGLHWCIYKPKNEEIEISKKVLDLKNYNSNRVNFYIIDSFDKLMEEIFLICKSNFPNVLTDPHRNSLPKEFYESVRSGSNEELTSNMRFYLNHFMDKAAKQIDTSEYLVIQADLKWELGADARKKGNSEEAKNLFNQGYDLLASCLNNECSNVNMYPELLIRALARKSGLCIGLAKLYKIDNTEKSKKLLNESIESIQEGINLYKAREDINLPNTLKGYFPYNGCCAYSLFAEWSNSLKDEDKNQVLSFIKEINRLDPERKHIQKLMLDSDFSYIQSKIKDKIKIT